MKRRNMIVYICALTAVFLIGASSTALPQLRQADDDSLKIHRLHLLMNQGLIMFLRFMDPTFPEICFQLKQRLVILWSFHYSRSRRWCQNYKHRIALLDDLQVLGKKLYKCGAGAPLTE